MRRTSTTPSRVRCCPERNRLASSTNLAKSRCFLAERNPKHSKNGMTFWIRSARVFDLEVPDAIRSLSHRAATQLHLQNLQNNRNTLRDVEAERDLPGNRVVAPRTERNVETPFAVDKP